MLDEKTMEDSIAANPERYLGEPGLKLLNRQLKIGSYRFDLVFQDRTGAKLIVEIQRGTLDRDHTYRILDYYDEYKDRHPEDFVEVMVVANVIPAERKRRLASRGISYREISPVEFMGHSAASTEVSTPASSQSRVSLVHPTEDKLIDNMRTKADFALFLDQQERFASALRAYDPTVWFPPLRGKFTEDAPGNWFICFVPAVWGRWDTNYGVHFDLIYARPRPKLPTYFRLVIGVESPLREEYRQAFKKEVISRIEVKAVDRSGFTLRAQNRKKLLEATPIPFSSESWRLAIDRYAVLRPVIEIVAEVIRDYVSRKAFDCFIEFP